MEKLNTLNTCIATPLNVTLSNEVERNDFIRNEVKNNRSHTLNRSAYIKDIEVRIQVTSYKEEGEVLIMYLFGEKNAGCYISYQITKGVLHFYYGGRFEDNAIIENEKFNKIGFYTTNDKVGLVFHVSEVFRENTSQVLETL